MDTLAPFYGLAVALALGLLIGLERGWKGREQAEGERVAGIRTYALIGLLGGVWGLLAEILGQVVLAVAFATLALVLIVAHTIRQCQDLDVGITGVIAGLLTFAFGALATLGYLAIAAAGAVVTATLLGVKPILHEWLQRLERRELHATLKLALISVVILPLLPNTGYGPWEALNPFRIWLMVVLIAGISFTGYFAMKVVGPRYGILATGLFAGLASSTAVTVNFARLARGGRGNEDVLAAGILVACATMFPRMLLVSGAFSPALAQALAAPVVAMAAINYLAAAWFWRASGLHDGHERPRMTNPFELKPALIFAALLAAIMLLSTALAETVGEVGVYLLAAVSGIADVDAITLSLAEMPGSRIEPADAALALIIAAAANSLVKAALALGIGGAPLGWRVTSSMLAVVATGVTVWLLLAALPAA